MFMPTDPLPVHKPAFSTQHYPDPLIAKPRPGMREVTDAESEGIDNFLPVNFHRFIALLLFPGHH